MSILSKTVNESTALTFYMVFNIIISYLKLHEDSRLLSNICALIVADPHLYVNFNVHSFASVFGTLRNASHLQNNKKLFFQVNCFPNLPIKKTKEGM